MPDINTPVEFDTSQQVEISAKLKDPNFKYSDWGNDDLLKLRRFVRNHYRKEQKKICSYCRTNLSLTSVNNSHVEHILPKSLYAQFIFEPKNLCVICADCNEIKRERETRKEEEDPLKRKCKRYPNRSEAFRIFHPHFDNYKDHIHKCGDIYFNISDKGAFTILTCKLNRKLYDYGMEPMLLAQPELFELMNKCLNETNYTLQLSHILKLQEYFIKIS